MTLNPAILKEYLGVAIEAAREAGNLLHGQGQSRVVSNLERDVKIEADKKIHEFLIRFLVGKTSLQVLSEEGSFPEKLFNGLHWIIDPIDGSVNYSRGIPLNCISVALWEKEQALLGVVYDFNRGEMFTGLVSEGALLNGRPIHVSAVKEIQNALLCTGFPVATDFSESALLQFSRKIQKFKKVRLLGTAALSLAYVAAGRADMYCEDNIALWDFAAGLALAKAAGGLIVIQPSEKTRRFHVQVGSEGILQAYREYEP